MRTTKVNVLIVITAVWVSGGLIAFYLSRSRAVTARKAPELQPPSQPQEVKAHLKTSEATLQATLPPAAQPDNKPATSLSNDGGPNKKPVALVNGTAITVGELEDELNRLLISTNTHAGMDVKRKDELRKIALDELIVRELAYQEGKASGIVVDEVELIAATRRIRHRYKTEKSFKQALEAEQITEEEFEHRVEKDLLLKKVFQTQIEDKAAISEAEVRQYYEQNRAKFLVPESLKLRGILIKTESVPEAEAKRKIDELYAKLKAGGDFTELAYKFSEDDYRVMGGDYGSVHRGQLIPELEQVAFAQKPGEISHPFRTSLGWQIVEVENRQPERQLKYEEVRERIKTALHQQREKEKRLDFINGLKATAKIEYLDH